MAVGRGESGPGEPSSASRSYYDWGLTNHLDRDAKAPLMPDASRPARPFKKRPTPGGATRRRAGGGAKPSSAGEPRSSDRHRLQKVLALAGLGSRRKCEQLITTGRVEVDGQTVIELGTRVDPHAQEIRVDGEPLAKARLVYYLVNKPPGVVSTNYDPAGRPRVIDLIPPSRERIYTVGRLDMSSEGLILVTNDGELANQLTHPRYGVQKTYNALVAGEPTREDLEQLTSGVHLAEGVARATRVAVKSSHKDSTSLEIVLQEGKNREIRRLLARVGHKVLKLRRVAIGHLKLKNLPPGEFRRLTRDEVQQLRREARLPGAPREGDDTPPQARVRMKPVARQPRRDKAPRGKKTTGPRR